MDLNPGDIHIEVSHEHKTAHVFRKTGTGAEDLFTVPVLTVGARGGQAVTGGDTPFGTYEVSGDPIPTLDTDSIKIHLEYGVFFIPLTPITSLARPEEGIGMHSGGTALGYPSCMAPYQPLVPTLGCLRFHNQDMIDKLVPLVRAARAAGHRVLVTVGP